MRLLTVMLASTVVVLAFGGCAAVPLPSDPGQLGFKSRARSRSEGGVLFGRPPDAVVRKSGQGGVPANWMRARVAPLRYQGQSVFLVQAGRPVGGRFAAAEGKELVLHPDVDEARDLLIQDLLYSGGLAGTTYHTDGLRAVMFFATRPLALSDVRLLDWLPYLERREAGTAAEHTLGRP